MDSLRGRRLHRYEEGAYAAEIFWPAKFDDDGEWLLRIHKGDEVCWEERFPWSRHDSQQIFDWARRLIRGFRGDEERPTASQPPAG